MVIGNLHNDRETLLQCSLVCKAWVPPSSIHLFHSFEWPPCQGSLTRFGRACPSQHTEESRIPTFQSLLLSSPRICASIRKLRFGKHHFQCLEHYGFAKRGDYTYLFEPNDQILANFTTLSQALKSFPRLSQLDVCADFDQSSIQRSEPSLTLDALQVRLLVTTPTFEPVLAFLTSFRWIGRLLFQVSGCEDRIDEVPVPYTFPTPAPHGVVRVDCLEVCTPDDLNPLRTVIDFDSVQTLELRFAPIKEMLQQMRSLHTLCIRLTYGVPTLFDSTKYIRSAPTPLGTISTTCYLGQCVDDRQTFFAPGGSWDAAMRNLQDLANTTTSYLVVQVLRDTDFPLPHLSYNLPEEKVATVERVRGALEALDWQRLEEVAQAYPSLKHLEVHFYHDLRKVAARFGLQDTPASPHRAKEYAQLLERIARQRLSARVVGRIPVTIRTTLDLSDKTPFAYSETIIIT